MAKRKERTNLVTRVRALEEAVELSTDRIDTEVVDEAARVVRQVDRRMAISGDATVVALAGATGSGKSSTFNALAGSGLAATGVKRPTTSQAMAATWGADSAEELLDWLQVPRRHALPAKSGIPGLVLLDLPDHDSTELQHRMEVDRLVQLVDLLIWVVDPQKYADAALHDQYLKPLADHSDVMLVVLNQIDRLPVEQVERCVRDLRRLLDSEGLAKAPIFAVSARTGAGVDQLKERLTQLAKDKTAAGQRLSADVATSAGRLSAETGHRDVLDRVSRSHQNRLNETLSQAAAVPVVVEAVEQAWKRRGGIATGWPALSWIAKLKPDPLRRLHLDRFSSAKATKEIDPVGVSRTSLPATSGVQRARMETAVRDLANDSSVGMPRGWADAVKTAARSRESSLNDDLDRAVAGTDLEMERSTGWWKVIRVLQWILIAAVVVGFVWLGIAFFLAYLQSPPLPAVTWWGIPAPTVLTLGGVLAGVALALLSRVAVNIGARAKAARVRSTLLQAISRVSYEHIITPVDSELGRYAQARAAINRAQG